MVSICGMGMEGVGELKPVDRMARHLSPSVQKAHQAIMRQYLEAIHEIVGVLARVEFDSAQIITKTQVGFAKHRETMRRQNREAFLPGYHDHDHDPAIAHHEAAEELAEMIPSRNFKQILVKLDRTLEGCVTCHRRYRL